MKPNNKDCKIVQDLLPNYIEELTDGVTNEYIEEHIVKCSECANVLKAMNGDIKLEAIQQDKEINYLKNVRKRVKRTIAIVSLVVIIVASGIVEYIHNQSKMQVNNYTFLRASYISENEAGTKDGRLYGTILAVFDEKEICKSVRIVKEGYTQETMENLKQLNEMNSNAHWINMKIEKDKMHYNDNIYNGISKQEFKNKLINNYHVQNIEEI